MELGDLAHEMIHPVRAGGEGHLFLRLGRIPLGLGEEPEVEMGIAALVAARRSGAGIGRGEDLLDAPLSSVKVEDLLHRHPGIVADRQ